MFDPAVAKQLAELVFPDVTVSVAELQQQYPQRALPPEALVTRFAPSPTGFVHIGSIMTAMVSRTLARQSGGVFILRIEDTDKKREQDGSIEQIIRSLINFDLRPDEGLIDIEPLRTAGNYGPYIQSERMALYAAFAKHLIAAGHAYPCFASETELDNLRKQQDAEKVRPGYYGPYALWRDAGVDAVRAELEAGKRPVIRIRAPYPTEARIRLNDVVKGELDLPANDLDSVLLKSDGLPTYHFAVVVDDTLMHVNLVIRGDEWLPSAPLHLQVYEFLGLRPPRFAHIAPIAKMDGTSKRKLSKRKDPEANMAYYHELGYPDRAVLEYLLNLANSSFYDWRKANPDLPYSEFPLRLEQMGVASPLFDIVKLNDISKDVIATYSAEQVYEAGLRWARQYRPDLAALLESDPAYSVAVFGLERSGPAPRKDIVNWSDIERAVGFFYDELYDDTIRQGGYPMPAVSPEDIEAILHKVKAFDLARPKEEWLAELRDFAEQIGFARDAKTYKKAPDQFKGQFGDVMMVIRVALTGKTNTPDLYEIMRIMGRQRVDQRMDRTLAAQKKS
jgi:glutamyl-tRNA synthetase